MKWQLALFAHCSRINAMIINNDNDLSKMRAAGRLAAEVLEMIEPHVQVGVTTEELDRICCDFVTERGGVPAALNYRGFPYLLGDDVLQKGVHLTPTRNGGSRYG